MRDSACIKHLTNYYVYETATLIYMYLQDHDDKELNYALVRLVRSLGSSQTVARKGNYSTLTVFLMMHPEISIEKLLSITNTQLQPIGKNSKSV